MQRGRPRKTIQDESSSMDANSAAIGREILGTIDVMEGISEDMRNADPNSENEESFDEFEIWKRKSPMERATPKPRPGYVQEWKRIAFANGEQDIANKQSWWHEGWRPRMAETLDKDDSAPIFNSPGIDGGVIVYKGQNILCEMKEEKYRRLLRAIDIEADRLSEVIYKEVKENNRMNPRFATVEIERPT